MNPLQAKKDTYSPEKVAHALAILEKHGGKVLPAAKEAGVSRGALRRWANGTARRQEVNVIRVDRDAAIAADRDILAQRVYLLTLAAVDKARELVPNARTIRDLSSALQHIDTWLTLAGARKPEQQLRVSYSLADRYIRAGGSLVGSPHIPIPETVAGEGGDQP